MRGTSILRLGAAAFAAMLAALAASSDLPRSVLAAPAQAQGPAAVPTDPAIKDAVLANGMRYMIRRNATPAGMVSMRLVILAGSMNEPPGQEGIAHFVEHMAFHGSKGVPDGEVERSLQRIGLRLGPDLNAITSPAYTLYRFDLNRGDAETVEKGLFMLREIAGELNLDAAGTAVERPVIAAEARMRSVADQASSAAVLRAELGDHPFARSPIGEAEVIRSATPAQLRAFYEAFYRPERAVLIVVGDADTALIEARIKALFGDWQGKGEPGRDPPPVHKAPPGPAVQAVAVEGGRNSLLAFIHARPYEPPRNTVPEMLRRELRLIGEGVYRQRIRDIAEAQGKPMGQANGVRETRIPRTATLVLEDAGQINDPLAAVRLMVAARDQLLTHGVTEDELRGQIRARAGGLNTAVATAATRATSALANEMVQRTVNGETIVSPEAERSLFQELSRQFRVEQVNAVLREALAEEGRLLYIADSPPPGGEAALAEAVAAGHAQKLAAYAPATARPWPFRDFGSAGRVVERREHPDLKVTLVRFANGVQLAVRSSDLVKNQVYTSVRFGHGLLGFHRDRQTAEDLAVFMLNEAEMEGLSRQQAQAALMGRAQVQAYQREDAFELANTTAIHPTNLDVQMQLYAARISRPSWRMDGWPARLAQAAQTDRAAALEPAGAYARHAPLLLHAGDMRWAVNDETMRASWKPEEAVGYIAPILARAPLLVTISGDVSAERAIEAVRRTLGALPPRRDEPEPADLRKVSFPRATPQPIVLRHKGPADRALVVINWPTTGAYEDPRDTFAAAVVTDILRLRLVDQLRRAEGRTYAPAASSLFSAILPKYGYMGVTVPVEPEAIDKVFAEIDAIAADLAARPVSDDELARAVRPRIEAAKRELDSNTYWMNILPRAVDDRRALDFTRKAVPILSSITAADVRASARKWLVKSKSWRAQVVAEARPAASGSTASR